MLSTLKRVSFTQWILVSMAVGILLGATVPDFAVELKPLSTIFLRLIKTLIVPLIFSTLVIGIAGHGDDMKKVGRLALRSIVYFEVVTTLALAVGLAAVNLVKPGDGIGLGTLTAEEGEQFAQKKVTLAGVLEHTVPQSFFEAAANNEVLQVVVFAILFAVALARVRLEHKQPMLSWLESLSEVMFKFVGLVMAFAPFGIGAAIAVTVAKSGIDVLQNLGLLVVTLYAALVVFALGVLVPVALLFRIPLAQFLAAVKQPALIAFSTASSEAALPRAMEAMERFGVPRRIVAFVMPTGYSFNLDGSTLYLALASVFVAQAAGIDMPLSQQLLMMLTLMLTSKGVAAVPRASLVILSGALASFGLPLQGVALILGVDAVMDMARTSINLVGNCLATAVMARWEGEFRGAEASAEAKAAPALARELVER
ncbi:MAG TPA: cation:dicarboxylase symporter family transporter [Planctomycetota bacterium]|nr:cation:dicarboxylase symporter family transporter [Planctomycetota bacterium]